MRRSGLILASLGLSSMLALGGCVTAPRYVSSDGGDYYYDEPRSVGYMPDYFAYSSYYSALWPVYCPWWDAFCDSFHYGVTFFPNRYFGVGYNYYGFAYSPWYGSWLDSYYDWNWWHYHSHHISHDAYHRFGSAQNEARAVAMLSRDSAPPRGAGLRSTPNDAAALGDTRGATLRSRSAPLGRNGEEMPGRRGETNDQRAFDPYYGAPVRRSAGMDDPRSPRRDMASEERPLRHGADFGSTAPARGQRFSSGGTDVDDTGRAARRGDSPSPRTWSVPRNDAGRTRDDGTFAPRQESPRFVPRESGRGAEPASAPVMHAAPAPVVRSAPVSAPSAPPSPRAGKDDGNR